MTLRKISLFCTLAFLFSSCCKDLGGHPTTDYLIFGHFYGECGGEGCIEIYKLEKEKLFEDTNDIYPNADTYYHANYVQLSEEKFKMSKDLVDSFPTDLLKEGSSVIGDPDAGDWGGLYIEYNFNGFRKFWLLDQNKNNVPEKYHRFIDLVNDKIWRIW